MNDRVAATMRSGGHVSGVGPRADDPRLARKHRGALIEPIYLCVGFAISIDASSVVTMQFGADHFNIVLRAVSLMFLAIAVVLLLVEMRRGRPAAARRYGVSRKSRLPFRIRFRWPIVVTRLHLFDQDAENKWHSDNCWCRRG